MKIRFIGNIGVGKTTAICSLLKLTDANGLPVLDTGSGRTTACDVHIRLFTGKCCKSSISVEEYDDIEHNQLFEKLDHNPNKISQEVKQILNNIRLNNIDREIDGFNENEILNRSRLQHNFHAINKGTHPRFGVPKKISILFDIGPDINDYLYGNCFVDTKGIEFNMTNENTKIKEYFDKDIYCSSFSNGPESSIMNMIKESSKKKGNKYILIISKYNEPENVVGAESYAEGVQIKMQQFLMATQGHILRENIMFIDSNRIDDNHRTLIFEKILK
jgi:hypothetical protein